jgi:hypothetical protein
MGSRVRNTVSNITGFISALIRFDVRLRDRSVPYWFSPATEPATVNTSSMGRSIPAYERGILAIAFDDAFATHEGFSSVVSSPTYDCMRLNCLSCTSSSSLPCSSPATIVWNVDIVHLKRKVGNEYSRHSAVMRYRIDLYTVSVDVERRNESADCDV